MILKRNPQTISIGRNLGYKTKLTESNEIILVTVSVGVIVVAGRVTVVVAGPVHKDSVVPLTGIR